MSLYSRDCHPQGQLELSTPISSCTHIPAREQSALSAAGITTVADLLNWLPKRHEDRRRFDSFPTYPQGSTPLCLRGRVVQTAWKQPKSGRGLRYFEIVVEDSSSVLGNRIYCRWFGMPYISRVFASGMEVILFGKAKMFAGQLSLSHPDFEIIPPGTQPNSIHLDRIVPVYRGITGISPNHLRETIFLTLLNLHPDACALAGLRELRPDSLPRATALKNAHFPDSLEAAAAARRFFALDEALTHQISVLQRKHSLESQPGLQTAASSRLVRDLADSLPFELTDAQKNAIREIYLDMRASRPMNRLLQGDVGSGKTLVAVCAMLLAAESGFQSALMAPTQILAEQHFQTFSRLLAPLDISIALKTAARDSFQSAPGASPQIIIGTHALLHHPGIFHNLGLVVIDEQHKFGVEQRDKLTSASHATPDVLVMTATPIPRTLTLSFYGELDVSILDQRPAGRGPIVTALRKHRDLPKITSFILSELENDRQVYIVSPLVEEQEKKDTDRETTDTKPKSRRKPPKSAIAQWEEWKRLLPHFDVGLLHGRMSPDEKDRTMRDFRANKLQVLVATTVIEVGVDVPNANIMVINNAERFGLAQLHQLRGRIGRGSHKSWCILLSDASPDDDNYAKLEVMARTCDGFEIAEADLKLRGPGELLGTAQAGLGQVRFEEWLLDARIIHEAREIALKMFPEFSPS